MQVCFGRYLINLGGCGNVWLCDGGENLKKIGSVITEGDGDV